MRNLPAKLLILAAIFLPLTAKAATIDNFVLTDTEGETISFSLPASPPIFGPTNPYLFETFEMLLTFNPPYFGNTTLDGQIVFYSALSGGGLEVLIYHPGGTTFYVDNGPVLYSGTTIDPTFLTGTFPLTFDTLTITPQATPTPEPSTLALLATGVLSLVCLAALSSPQIRGKPRNSSLTTT